MYNFPGIARCTYEIFEKASPACERTYMCMCSHSHFSAYLHVHLTLRCPEVRERASEEEEELLTLSIDERFARRRCSIAGRHGTRHRSKFVIIGSTYKMRSWRSAFRSSLRIIERLLNCNSLGSRREISIESDVCVRVCLPISLGSSSARYHQEGNFFQCHRFEVLLRNELYRKSLDCTSWAIAMRQSSCSS